MAVVPVSTQLTAAELDQLKEEMARSLGMQDLILSERWPNPSSCLCDRLQENKLPLRSILSHV
ncbi:hypothetical protein DNHGIG_35990 [Collibacillus ludicampi]|uniref:Uncharacterized protein n=1 Tax=Collibacillus ludicampi TaxID=2771369 RepID=A0AAV4LJL2_9BACL|nr:hypothetical protein [Collibacillus ludicampi]GIM48050.1 hypothetical protein DNHGIG_35990 [Collibacillus ludicampi]